MKPTPGCTSRPRAAMPTRCTYSVAGWPTARACCANACPRCCWRSTATWWRPRRRRPSPLSRAGRTSRGSIARNWRPTKAARNSATGGCPPSCAGSNAPGWRAIATPVLPTSGTRWTSTRRTAGIWPLTSRRPRAAAGSRAWLEAELARGDEEALSLYIEALDGGSALYPRDRFAAELHRYVLTLMRARRMGQFETEWARGPYRHAALTPAQWDEVARRGRALYARAFRDAAE